jgi:hypothetical protein
VHGGLKKSSYKDKIDGRCRHFGAWWTKKELQVENANISVHEVHGRNEEAY